MVQLIFERIATSECWDKGLWALQLAPYLVGDTHATYMTLRQEQAKNYDVLKAAILDPVGLSAEMYLQKFRAARWT